jgi:hypothetical protein
MTPPGAWSTPLQRSFTSFPAGPVGAALFAMRAVVGVIAVAQSALAVIADPCTLCLVAAVPAALAGLALLPGFATPLASALLASEAAALLFGMRVGVLELLDSRIALFEFTVMAATLAVVGPGALSVDSMLFGRREVTIDR